MMERGYLIALSTTLLTTTLSGKSQGVTTYQRPEKFTFESLPEAKKGGEIRIPMLSNANSFFQFMSPGYDLSILAINGPLYMDLMDPDPETYDFMPRLALSYEVSADRKTYTFKLNPEAKWSNGDPITAGDVVFTLNTIHDKKVDAGRIRPYYEGVSAKAIDKHTVQFYTENPKFNTLSNLCNLHPVSQKYLRGKDINKQQNNPDVPTSGPYSIKEYKPDLHLILERKKNWWGEKQTHLSKVFNFDTIYLPIINDRNLAYEKAVKGEVDVLQALSADVWSLRVKGNDKSLFASSRVDALKSGKKLVSIKTEDKAPKTYDYIGWNTRHTLFSDRDVRVALSHLLPYKEIMSKAYFDLAIISTSPFGSFTKNSDQNLRKKGTMVHYNPKKAMKLLKSAGWSDSDRNGILDKVIDGKKTDFAFTLKYNQGNTRRKTIAFLAKKSLKKFGIDVEAKEVEWTAMIDDLQNARFQAYILGWGGGDPFYRDPKQIWHSSSYGSGGSNMVGYQSKSVDDAIAEANLEFDIEKRTKIMQRISRLIYEDQPYTFLGERDNLHVFSTSIVAPKERYFQTYDELPIETFQATVK